MQTHCFRRQGINNPRGFDRNRDFRDLGPRLNERIRVREVLVIDDNNEKLGVMPTREAIELARSRGLDLIEVAAQAQPPVCRILDYGKFKYEQGKREREAAKKSRQSELKGMTLRPGTDDHDLDFKIKNVVKFLADGDKVKVTVRFKSREMSHPEFAHAALNKIVAVMQEQNVGVVERPALMEGRQMIMILAPQKEGAAKKPPTPSGGASAPKNSAPKAPATAPVAAASTDGAAPSPNVAPPAADATPSTNESAPAPAVVDTTPAPETVPVPAAAGDAAI